MTAALPFTLLNPSIHSSLYLTGSHDTKETKTTNGNAPVMMTTTTTATKTHITAHAHISSQQSQAKGDGGEVDWHALDERRSEHTHTTEDRETKTGPDQLGHLS